MGSNDTSTNPGRDVTNQSYKVLLVGGSSVGKTCVLRSYVEGEFPQGCKATLGLDFKIRTLVVDKEEIRLQLWDTSGQERFRSMTQAYYRGAAGVVLVYDITAEESFTTLTDWLGDIRMYAPEDCKVILLGNKCDVEEEERAISRQAGEEFAKVHGLKHFETSAMINHNVIEAFEYLARLLRDQERQRVQNGIKEKADSVIIPKEQRSKSEKRVNCPC